MSGASGYWKQATKSQLAPGSRVRVKWHDGWRMGIVSRAGDSDFAIAVDGVGPITIPAGVVKDAVNVWFDIETETAKAKEKHQQRVEMMRPSVGEVKS